MWLDEIIPLAPQSNLLHSLDHAQAQLEELYAKQGRISRFGSQSDRDAYLKREISALGAYEMSLTEQTSALRVEHEGTLGRSKEYADKAREADQALENRRDALQTLAAEISELRKAQVELMEQRKYGVSLKAPFTYLRLPTVQRNVARGSKATATAK